MTLELKYNQLKNVFQHTPILLSLLMLSQTASAVTNNVSKEYVDGRFNELTQQINQLKEITQHSGVVGPAGPSGPMGPAGLDGQPGPAGTPGLEGPAHRTYVVGQKVLGGVVFYVDGSNAPGATGHHGLIAAREDNSDNTTWDGYASSSGSYDFVTNARGNGIQAGRNNTFLIIAAQSFNAYKHSRMVLNPFAAQVCSNYCVNEDGKTPCSALATPPSITGYADWYLPSLAELDKMWGVKELGLVGQYWSSTEDTATEAYYQSAEGQAYGAKNSTAQVRCIRSF